MEIFAAFLLIAFAILVIKLIVGVQKAKRNGTYLQPDNLAEYGVVELDETTLIDEDVFHTEQSI